MDLFRWFQKRALPENYQALRPVERVVAGTDWKQRPKDKHVTRDPMGKYQEDNIYHSYEVGRVWAEMVRPDVHGEDWGGFDWVTLRFAGLARSIQSRFYLHSCTTRYCLQGSSQNRKKKGSVCLRLL